MSSEDAAGLAARQSGARPNPGVGWAADGALLRVCAALLRHAPFGRLRLTLPSGRQAVFGVDERGVEASMHVKRYSALWRLARRGALGFAESYMEGDIATDNLRAFFDYYSDNELPLARASGGFFQRARWSDRLFHRRRANTPKGSRRNISAHYDLGNDFYRLWLDPGMTYSSAIYSRKDMSLEEAQRQKHERILEALEIEPGQSLFEIGCGWGSLAQLATERGAEVTGITISRNQFDEARARISRLGLESKVDIRFEDYRASKGLFDRLASIEMIEAVGEDNWATYFKVIAERLKPGGVAVLQAITIRDDLYETYQRNPDFIQRYIFPGGMLPTVEAMRTQARATGLVFEPVETFAGSYARTLAEWRERFNATWADAAKTGLDERFRRMWNYYLIYCEVGFERGFIDVGLYRLRKTMAAPDAGEARGS